MNKLKLNDLCHCLQTCVKYTVKKAYYSTPAPTASHKFKQSITLLQTINVWHGFKALQCRCSTGLLGWELREIQLEKLMGWEEKEVMNGLVKWL